MPIPGSVANLPVIGPWLTMREQNQTDVPGQQLQQMNQFATLQQNMQQQQDRQMAAQRDMQFRQRMAGAQTDEERARIAMEAEGAKGVLSHLDRQAGIKATQENARARVGAQLQGAANTHEARMRAIDATLSGQALTAAKNAEIARHNGVVEGLQSDAMKNAGARLYYDTGILGANRSTPQVAAPQQPPMQGQAPQAEPYGPVLQSIMQNAGVSTPQQVPMIRGSAGSEAEAVAAINQGRGIPMSLEIPTQSPAAAVAAPMQAPQPALSAPQAPVQPAMPNNMDARDLGAMARPTISPQEFAANAGVNQPAKAPGAVPAVVPQPGQGVPGVRAAQQMPAFTGSPKEIARAKNDWLSDMAKADQKAATKDGKIGINVAGGRESVFINRVVNSGNQAAADLANVVQLPISASRGLFGGRSQGKGLLDAGIESLANTMTTQEVQTYNVFATGFQRALAAIEGAGLAPSNALMHQMDAVIFKEGDTNFTKLAKLAQTRQIVEKGLETITANSRVDAETKKLVENIVDKVRKAVPFTGSELIELGKLQATNKNATLRDVMAAEKAASGSWDNTKEQRYQELLRKQSGS